MSTGLAQRGILPGELREDGIVIPEALSFDEWRQALGMAELIERASPWWLCDLMGYGEEAFPDQYTQALPTPEDDPTGARQSKLKQAAWMAEKYPRNQRVPGLSYTHHRACAELPPDERQALLREAAEQHLSTRQLIERVRDRQAAIGAEARTVDGQACAAEAGLREPTEDDLTDDARAALAFKRDSLRVREREGFAQGWVAALAWIEADDCFRGADA